MINLLIEMTHCQLIFNFQLYKRAASCLQLSLPL